MDAYEESKCRKHPVQNLTGICPFCLANRLRLLCPECAALRPCKCSPTSFSDLNSSSTSYTGRKNLGVGAVGRVSNLIDAEPSFSRSKSARIGFFRSKSRSGGSGDVVSSSDVRRRRSVWSFLKRSKKDVNVVNVDVNPDVVNVNAFPEKNDELPRSRSVAIPQQSDPGGMSKPTPSGNVPVTGAAMKTWRWSFGSPIKAFRQSKAVNGWSPLSRG